MTVRETLNPSKTTTKVTTDVADPQGQPVVAPPELKVKSKEEMSTEDFQAMDARDEEQLVSMSKGQIVDEYFYRFQQGGGYVQGISISGVYHWAKYRGNLICDRPVMTETETYWHGDVSCTDVKINLKIWGQSSQSKFTRSKERDADGQYKEDPYARTKAGSKAQRNSLRHLMPETVIKAWAEEWFDKRDKSLGKSGVKAPAVNLNKSQLIEAKSKTLLKLNALGYSEKSLSDWINKKFGVQDFDQLSLDQWRAVYKFIISEDAQDVLSKNKAQVSDIEDAQWLQDSDEADIAGFEADAERKK